ncbi:MAG TPA: ARMT1-like domain-containing protein [Candidatus Humimicrobiaceae bacterium]
MKIYHECIACHIRSAVTSAMIMTDDEKLRSAAVKKALVKASDFGSYENLFELFYDIQKEIKAIAPDMDPYLDFKKEFNRICLSLSEEYREKIEKSGDHFEMALRLCLAGNSIDVMQGKKMSKDYLKSSVETALKQPLDAKMMGRLKNEILKAKKILVIGDNAGEIVFDKLFIEFLNRHFAKEGMIIYSVRGGHTLNDSTIDDAIMTGIDKVVKVITTGVDMPAAHLPTCSEEFNQCFREADLVISKGQGNLEALIDEKKNIYFLLKIKCNVIANMLDHKHKVDEIVIFKNEN